MAEGQIKNYIIGIIIFTLFIVGGISMIGIFETNKPGFIDSDQYNTLKTLNNSDQLQDQINNLENQIKETDTDFGVLGVLNGLINSAWTSLSLVFDSFGFMKDAFTDLSNILGIPAWIPGLLVGIITVVIVFSIFAAIFQREP